jgi:hypothetical protein
MYIENPGFDRLIRQSASVLLHERVVRWMPLDSSCWSGEPRWRPWGSSGWSDIRSSQEAHGEKTN